MLAAVSLHIMVVLSAYNPWGAMIPLSPPPSLLAQLFTRSPIVTPVHQLFTRSPIVTPVHQLPIS